MWCETISGHGILLLIIDFPVFKLTEPLHQLMGKDIPCQWTSDCQEAFEALKTRLTEALVLAYPAFDQNFVLGAVLYQCRDGKLHPVGYGLCALPRPEKNYSITKLETFALVWIINHFRH